MVKKVVIGVLVATVMSSCSTFRSSSASSMEVETSLISSSTADLEISNQKISYTYYPKKADRKTGFKHILRNATAAALKENGNADVLVRKDKVKSITVTGYPGTYKNFKVEPIK